MIQDVALSIVTRVVVMSAGIVTSVLTARALGVSGRGEYFLVVTMAGLAMQFGSLGVGSSNTFFLAKDHNLLPRLTANSAWLALTIGTLIAAGLICGNWSAKRPNFFADPMWVLLLMVPTMLFGLLASNLLIGLSLFRQYNLFQLASCTFQVLAIGLAAWMAWGVQAFLLVSALTGMVTAVLLVSMLSKVQALTWRFDWQLLRDNVGYAGRAYATTLFGYFINRAGVIQLDYFADRGEVGIYSVAVQFSDGLMVLPSTVAMVLFPGLLREGATSGYERTVRITGRVAVIMALLCVVTGIVAHWIIPALFGNEFAPAIIVLWWMLPGVFFLSLANVMSQFLAARGMPLVQVWIWGAGFGVLLGSGTYLIPRWGAAGTAASQSVTYVLMAVALTLLAVKHAAKVESGVNLANET